jgi:hypothetical protein
MVRSRKPIHNTLSLDMRCEEGRELVQLDIDFLTDQERKWLFDLLQTAQKGRQVGFGVESPESGEQIIKFTLGALAAPTH